LAGSKPDPEAEKKVAAAENTGRIGIAVANVVLAGREEEMDRYIV
jgi:hypothetical protein